MALFRQDDPFSTLAWYRATAAHAVPQGVAAAFLVARHAGQVLAVLPMQRGPGRFLASLASPYASLWQPLMGEVARRNPACMRRVGLAVGLAFQAMKAIRLDALDAESDYLAPFEQGVREAGFHPLRFDHFGNWQQALPPAWGAYLAGRPAKLRATIRRRGRRLMSDLCARIEVVEGGENLERAIAEYQSVYAASWKTPEMFKGFFAAFMREAARAGTLRLFLMHVKNRPVAAQIWIVQDGSGHLLKLAHVERDRALSPGTVLTACAIEHLMQHDRIGRLDFGRGDDAYKALWASERRQRVGFLFANPGTLAGAAAIARHVAGVVLRPRKPTGHGLDADTAKKQKSLVIAHPTPLLPSC